MLKTFEKHKILRNLTCFFIALNLFRLIEEYDWHLYLINFLRYNAMCFHGNSTLATVKILKYGQSISVHANSR